MSVEDLPIGTTMISFARARTDKGRFVAADDVIRTKIR